MRAIEELQAERAAQDEEASPERGPAAPSLSRGRAFTRRSFVKGAAVGAISLTMSATALGSLASCAQARSAAQMTLRNVTEQFEGRLEADALSLTEQRTFKVSAPLEGETAESIQEKIDKGRISWTLSREAGQQDEELFPYQWLGGPLESWKTIKTEVQDETQLFFDIAMEASEDEGRAVLTLTFSARSLFGYDGIDARENRALERNTILDYTGRYTLSCLVDGSSAANLELDLRPYDYYRDQKEIEEELAKLVDQAKEGGLYAELRTIASSAHGRDVDAVFVAKQKEDLDGYLGLVERMKTEPAAVQEEVRGGALSYKVPVMYSNIHPDEIVGCDGVVEFLRLLASNRPVEYLSIAGLTDLGKQRVKEEMDADGVAWSPLIADKVSGVGYLRGKGVTNPTFPASVLKKAAEAGEGVVPMTVDMDDEELRSYYDLETLQFDPSAVLDQVFFILVPMENPDGRAYNTRTNGNGFDLNRDNTYQTQPETQAMTQLIARYNPISLHEIHGYYPHYQVEPCSPPHDPNNEYDLFIDTGMEQGEAFVAASIVNNVSINAAKMPMRDFLKKEEDGSVRWEFPFDDMTSSYTPQYAMLHGSNAYTVELPFGSQDAVDATIYGMVGNARFVVENKDRMFINQLERYRRGLENIDAEELDPYYVSQSDGKGAEAKLFRPRHQENDNFFPEYYAIPLDPPSQRNRRAAADMVAYLNRNDVTVKALTQDVDLPENAYRGALSFKAGTVIVDLHQAKRNMAHAALYSNLVLDQWTGLYSEPVTDFPLFRGFDAVAVTTPGAFDAAGMEVISEAPQPSTVVEGEGPTALISNAHVQAVQAVNSLLAAGQKVGLVVEGSHAGDFVVASEALDAVRDDYVLEVRKIARPSFCHLIKQDVKVYVPGSSGEFMSDESGRPFGVRRYKDRLLVSYNWDRFALREQMGFNVVDTAEEADVIVGNNGLSKEEEALVAAGKPYVGYGAKALASVKEAGLALEFTPEKGGDFDALTTVRFKEPSLVTSAYRNRDDRLMYGYGGAYFTKLPPEAKVLVTVSDDAFVEGFMSAEHSKGYRSSTQVVEYAKEGWNTVLFANSLTNKAHQVHEYRYLALALYSRLLGEEYKG